MHDLKIDNEYFEHVLLGTKTFEIRKNDRNFNVGDIVILNEWNNTDLSYTGRKIICRITYVTNYEQKQDYYVFSFIKLP